MVNLIVRYEKYDRMGGNVRKLEVEGNNLKDALLALLECLNMYTDVDTILEIEEDENREVSAEEIIEMLESENGDGCDYIYYIMDKDSKVKYMDWED